VGGVVYTRIADEAGIHKSLLSETEPTMGF
jgi:hypothetical protein